MQCEQLTDEEFHSFETSDQKFNCTKCLKKLSENAAASAALAAEEKAKAELKEKRKRERAEAAAALKKAVAASKAQPADQAPIAAITTTLVQNPATVPFSVLTAHERALEQLFRSGLIGQSSHHFFLPSVQTIMNDDSSLSLPTIYDHLRNLVQRIQMVRRRAKIRDRLNQRRTENNHQLLKIQEKKTKAELEQQRIREQQGNSIIQIIDC